MRKLIIASFRGGILSCLTEDGMPVRLDFSSEQGSLVGNVYTARVQHIIKNLDAAFLEIGGPQNAYFNGTDPSKITWSDGTAHDRLREGDEILVRIRRDGNHSKGPLAVSLEKNDENEELLKKAVCRKAPACIGRGKTVWEETAEMLTEEDSIVTDLPDVYRTLTGCEPPAEESFLEKLPDAFRPERKAAVLPGRGTKVRFHEKTKLPLSAVCSLETIVGSATAGRVWLKSGGYLVIDRTEAMTVIDVNTGKDLKGKERQETIRRTDREAAEEIMRQIRLRNLSGIILCDFIDLRAEEDRRRLLELLRGLAAKDPVQTKVVDITRLFLVEITRKKTGKTIAEQLKNPLT